MVGRMDPSKRATIIGRAGSPQRWQYILGELVSSRGASGLPRRRRPTRARSRRSLWRRIPEVLSRIALGGLLLGCAHAPSVVPLVGGTPGHPIDVLAGPSNEAERVRAYRELADPQRLTPADRQFALEELVNGVQAEQSVLARVAVTQSLGGYPFPDAMKGLEHAARDPHPLVRAEAARALSRLNSADAIDPLATMARSDRIADVRRAAVEALTCLRDPRVPAALLEALRDEDLLVARTAALGLRLHTAADLGEDYEAWAAHLRPQSTRHMAALRPARSTR